jgi:hypothetical protein
MGFKLNGSKYLKAHLNKRSFNMIKDTKNYQKPMCNYEKLSKYLNLKFQGLK